MRETKDLCQLSKSRQTAEMSWSTRGRPIAPKNSPLTEHLARLADKWEKYLYIFFRKYLLEKKMNQVGPCYCTVHIQLIEYFWRKFFLHTNTLFTYLLKKENNFLPDSSWSNSQNLSWKISFRGKTPVFHENL